MYILNMYQDLHDTYYGEFENISEAHEKAEKLLKSNEKYTGYEIMKFKE